MAWTNYQTCSGDYGFILRQWRTEGIEQPNNIKVFVDRNSGAGGTHDYIGGHPGGGKQFPEWDGV